ncbi:MAG: hypothetical protein WBJ41_18425 [Chromatiaceae bacterium]
MTQRALYRLKVVEAVTDRRLKEPLREAIRALLVERYPDCGPSRRIPLPSR